MKYFKVNLDGNWERGLINLIRCCNWDIYDAYWWLLLYISKEIKIGIGYTLQNTWPHLVMEDDSNSFKQIAHWNSLSINSAYRGYE